MWFVRAAIAHLLIGFTLGALLLAAKGRPAWSAAWVLRDAHVEVVLIGWMTQLAMGVAVWILPRFALRRAPRYSDRTAWLAFGFLNAGAILVVLGAPLPGRVLEVAAALSFALHIWRRVVPAGLSAM